MKNQILFKFSAHLSEIFVPLQTVINYETMGIVIGIDVGISTTKIVGLRDKRVVSPIRITAADQVTSL